MRIRTPLRLVAGGLVLVVLDFRTLALDLVPDPLGWLLVAVGVAALGQRALAAGAVLAAALSLPEAFLEYRYRLIDPLTNDPVDRCPLREVCSEKVVFEPISGWRLAAVAAVVAVGAAVVLGLLRVLRRRAGAAGDDAAVARLGLVSVALVVGWVVPRGVGVVKAIVTDPVAYDPVWNDSAEMAALAGLFAVGWLVVELCLRARQHWAVPHRAEPPSPWAELIVSDRPD